MNPFVLLLGTALAGLDAHGPLPPPGDADPGRPLRLAGGQRLDGGSAGVLGEYASQPLNLFVQQGEDAKVVAIAQLEQLAVANLQLAHGFGPVAIGLVVPVAAAVVGEPGSGPALSDPMLTVPLTLADGGWGGVSIVPSLRLPIGADRRFLGNGSVTGAVRAAGTFAVSGFRTTVNAGVELGKASATQNVDFGGNSLVGGASVGWMFESASVGAHLEAVGSHGIGGGAQDAAAASTPSWTSPLELVATIRGAHGPGWWAVGGGTGLTHGIGSAALRLFAGGGARWGGAEKVEVVQVPDVVEAVVQPQTMPPTAVSVDVRDVKGIPVQASVRFESGDLAVDASVTDGAAKASLVPGSWVAVVTSPGFGEQRRTLDVGAEPVQFEAILLEARGTAALTLAVRDVDGKAPRGARVLIDGLPVGTAGHQQLVVGNLAPGEHMVSVRGHGYLGFTGAVRTGEVAEVLLHPVEGTLRVSVADPSGAAIPDAWVAFSGPTRRPAVPLDGDLERVFVLSTGHWTALVSSESHGVQSREVVLEDDAWTTTEARFVLGGLEAGPANLRVRVVDVDGQPVEGARVRLGEADLGETATGGDLQVSRVDVGLQDVHLELEGALAVESQEVLLRPGLQEVWFTVHWLPGTVRLRVRHPDGPVADAVALAAGPGERSPMALGPTGVATWRLDPGDWELLITSAQWGTASREIGVTGAGAGLTRVDVVLLPTGNAAGAARLKLAVRDPDGEPVVGAGVLVDSRSLGTTSTGGFAAPLTPGERRIGVRSSGFAAWEQAKLIAPGPNEVGAELSWHGMLRLAVVDPTGKPARDVVVRLAGAGRVSPPIPMGPEGSRDLPTTPGTWQAVVVSAEHGVATDTFEVPAGAGMVKREVRLLDVAGTQLLVEVRDEQGRSVRNALVSCEGCDPVRADAGVALLTGIPSSVRALSVTAPHHRPGTVEVDPSRSEVLIAQLAAVPVNLRVGVTGPNGEPIAATLRFDGPVAVPPALTGPGGSETVALVPGTWVVTAEGHGFGVRRLDIVVEPGASDLRVDFALTQARVTVDGSEVLFSEKVHFDLGSSVLTAASDPILGEVANTLVAHPELAVVEVQGHTDATGDLARNQELSEERAAAVRAALIRLGVAESRLVARGFGPTQPLADNDTDEGRQRNRRVQFTVLETALK